MEDKKLIAKIKEFSKIKPDKDWVLWSKKEIFKNEPQERFKISPRIWIPTLTSLSLAVIVLVLFTSGAFEGFSSLQLSSFKKLEPKIQLPFLAENPQKTQIKESIKTVNNDLKNVSNALDNLKSKVAQDPKLDKKMVINVAQTSKITALNTKEIAKKIEENKILNENEKSDILASLESNSQEVSQKSEEVQKEAIQSLIADLENKSLKNEDKAKLEKAKEYFQEDKINECLILISQIGN
jgi:flagellar biosynthesis GTPase FlhF